MMNAKLRAELIASDDEFQDFLCEMAVGNKSQDKEFRAAMRELTSSPYTATPRLMAAIENKLTTIITSYDYLDNKRDKEEKRKIDNETIKNFFAHTEGVICGN